MAYRLTWSPTSTYDLHNIAEYLSEESTSLSKKVILGIFSSVERLSAFPESGRVVPEFEDASIREIIQRPFRIVYRINNDLHVIEIIRIWHSARGIPDV
jgi:addiction module RelE/StbE family toxin